MKSMMKLLGLFFGLAILVNGANAESGLPGTASMTSPATADAPRSFAVNTPAKPASPLSAEQLQTILEDMQKRKKQAVLNAKLTDLLGLTKSGEVLTLLYRAVKDDQGIYHGFFRLNGNTGYLVLQRTKKGVTMCHVDMDLNPVYPVSAVTNPVGQPGVYVVTPRPEIEKMLHDELLVWADIANQIVGTNSQGTATSRP
jgi:hypothetical protein